MAGDDDVVFAAVLDDEPDVYAALVELRDAAWSTVDPTLLGLCEMRVAMLLGVAAGGDDRTLADLARWPTSDRFGERERACLAFCEQFVIDVAGMPDEIALAVADLLGPQGLRDFVAALLVVEQRVRLGVAWERLRLVQVTA
jgi:hypothetical protein